jgi:hypothetical protein
MAIVEDGEHAVVRVTAESKAVDLLRGNPRTYTDADQQALFPGDSAFNLVVSQASATVVWPSKDFFKK